MGMADLETRELEHFVAVAEELHFGRAAVRLSIAQPALSRTIRGIEARLGVQLLVRTSRYVSLTSAGQALLRSGRHALAAVGAAAESARRADDAEAQLRLVIKSGGAANVLSGILGAYSREPDARQVEILFGGHVDSVDYLRDGRADVALLYVPFDDLTGLEYDTLYAEGRIAILPPDHPLGSRTQLRLADLEHEPVPRWKGVPGGGTGPEIEDLAQLVQMVRLGRLVATLPPSLLEPFPPGLICIPVADAPTSELVLAWSPLNPSPLIASFVAAATAAVGASDGRLAGAS
jgi:DNA-binding transcriptional LysR family regulator